MTRKSNQTGSVHVIITVVLVVALLGALGFIFYQNYIAKKTPAQQGSSGDQASALTEFCTKTEKLCFSYNASEWSVTDSSKKLSNPIGDTTHEDRISVKHKNGDVELVFLNAISGIGGTCGDMPAVDSFETVTSFKTSLTRGKTSAYSTSEVYAVEGVYSDGDGHYYPQVFLTNLAMVETPGTYGPCVMFQSLVSLDKGYSMQFSNTGFGFENSSSKLQPVASRDEAIAKLNSTAYVQAADILKSIKSQN